MKMSGMLTRSSMACSFRPSRCRSKASPRMACERGSHQAQRLQAPRVPLTFLKGLWRQRLFHTVVPWTPKTRGSRQYSPPVTDGETEAQGPAQGGARAGFKNTGLQLGGLAPSWLWGLGRSLTSWSLSVFIYKMGMVTEFPFTGWQ